MPRRGEGPLSLDESTRLVRGRGPSFCFALWDRSSLRFRKADCHQITTTIASNFGELCLAWSILTLFAKPFASFNHSSCALSVSSRYSSLRQKHPLHFKLYSWMQAVPSQQHNPKRFFMLRLCKECTCLNEMQAFTMHWAPWPSSTPKWCYVHPTHPTIRFLSLIARVPLAKILNAFFPTNLCFFFFFLFCFLFSGTGKPPPYLHPTRPD